MPSPALDALAAWMREEFAEGGIAGPKRKRGPAEEAAAAEEEEIDPFAHIPPPILEEIARDLWSDPEPPAALLSAFSKSFARLVRAEMREAADVEVALTNIFREEERLRLFFSPLWKFPSLMAPGAFATHWALAERWLRVHDARGRELEHVFILGIPDGSVSPYEGTMRGASFFAQELSTGVDVGVRSSDVDILARQPMDRGHWWSLRNFQAAVRPRSHERRSIFTLVKELEERAYEMELVLAIYIGPAIHRAYRIFSPRGPPVDPAPLRGLLAQIVDRSEYAARIPLADPLVGALAFGPTRFGGFRKDAILALARKAGASPKREGEPPRLTSRSTKNAIVAVHLDALRRPEPPKQSFRSPSAGDLAPNAERELDAQLAVLAGPPWNYRLGVEYVGDPRRGGLLLMPLLAFVVFAQSPRGLLFRTREGYLRFADFDADFVQSVHLIAFPDAPAFARKLMPRDAIWISNRSPDSRVAADAFEALGLVFQESH